MSHIQSGLQFPKNVNGRQLAIHDFGKRDLCVRGYDCASA
jgi:hypothetical protein